MKSQLLTYFRQSIITLDSWLCDLNLLARTSRTRPNSSLTPLQMSDLGIVPRGLGLPIFSHGKDYASFDDILFPYWSFINTQKITTMHLEVPWEEKIPTAIWRGSTTGGLRSDHGLIARIGTWRNMTRALLVAECNAINAAAPSDLPPLCDAHFTAYVLKRHNLVDGEELEMDAELGPLVAQIPNEEQSRWAYSMVASNRLRKQDNGWLWLPKAMLSVKEPFHRHCNAWGLTYAAKLGVWAGLVSVLVARVSQADLTILGHNCWWMPLCSSSVGQKTVTFDYWDEYSNEV